MLPLYEEKCPCCDQMNLIPISLTYSKDISNYMNIETFMKLNSIFKYIQIYSVDYDLTKYDLCFIAYIAHKFNLKSFKKYLESIKYVFYGIEIIEDLYIELFSDSCESINRKINSYKIKKNFNEKTCIKDNLKIFSILIFIKHKFNYLKKKSKFDKCYTKVIKRYFEKARLPCKKLKKLDLDNPFYRIGELLFYLNLNVTRNFKPEYEENIISCK